MSSVRRLTAILAADVVGYSRLMGVDEEGTYERLRTHLADLIEPKIAEHHGRIVKTTGDGVLAEFASVDAVRCAGEIQREMADREPDLSEERRIRFRIGINLGDVIADGDDIYGDGVNIAARLEGLAEPGGICVSGTVRDHVGDRLPYAFADLGEQSVKNIARPVRVYALGPEATADLPISGARLPAARRRWPPAAVITGVAAAVIVLTVIVWRVWPIPILSGASVTVGSSVPSVSKPLVAPRLSIVVLPFTNLSNDPDQQYFADGITEDLTTNLSQLPDMFVISRKTAFTYQNKPVDTKDIGRELGVRYVLEGSVQRSGSRVRVNAQLIDAETDAHLWAERFDREASDLFALQDEITRRIAFALNIEITAAEAVRPAQNPDALDYVLRGRAALYRPTSSENYAEAIKSFEHALELDPQSVDAQIGLAQVLAANVIDFGTSSTAAADAININRAEALANRALAAAPRSPYAHLIKGLVLRVQHRCADAISEYQTVLAVDHNAAKALADIGRCRIYIGPIGEAIPLLEQAIRLSPRDPAIAYWYYRIGEAHLLQSHIDEAIVWLEKARAANQALPFVHAYLAAAYALKGEGERAAAELAEARTLPGGGAWQKLQKLSRVMTSRGYETPAIRALAEATLIEGLRKAGMSEQ
jgi:adenylate cyclase